MWNFLKTCYFLVAVVVEGLWLAARRAVRSLAGRERQNRPGYLVS